MAGSTSRTRRQCGRGECARTWDLRVESVASAVSRSTSPQRRPTKTTRRRGHCRCSCPLSGRQSRDPHATRGAWRNRSLGVGSFDLSRPAALVSIRSKGFRELKAFLSARRRSVLPRPRLGRNSVAARRPREFAISCDAIAIASFCQSRTQDQTPPATAHSEDRAGPLSVRRATLSQATSPTTAVTEVRSWKWPSLFGGDDRRGGGQALPTVDSPRAITVDQFVSVP